MDLQQCPCDKCYIIKKKHFKPVDQVREVKVVDVVAGNDVRIGLPDKLCPTLEQGDLGVVGDDVRANDGGARVQGEDVSDERFRLTLF